MSDDDATPPAPPSSATDGLRRATAAAMIAADNSKILSAIERLEGMGVDMSVLRTQVERSARYVRQIGAVNAAQALTYDAMIAAGGPENSEAYAKYEAATERNTALLPQDDLTDWS